MKRSLSHASSFPLGIAIILLTTLTLVSLSFPSLLFAQGGSGISYPPETEVVQGVIEIQGTAVHPEFWKYELAAAPFGTQNWFNLGVSESQVQSNVLGAWDTRTVPDGVYTLRLRVVRQDGNFDEYFTQRVQVANSQPVATPTLVATLTPTVTPTAKPPTATPVVLTPEIPTPTLSAPATATPDVAAAAGDSGGASGLSIGSLSSRAASAFVSGAEIVLGVFLAIGIFFGVKGALTWFYYRFIVSR